MNLGEFEASVDRARTTIGCLTEPVTKFDAAGFHRVMALEAFIAQDSDRTLNSFRASLALQPDYSLPSSLAPPGNPLHESYLEARHTSVSSMIALDPPRNTVVIVDGVRATQMPVDRPVVVQVISDSGSVERSGYIATRQDIGGWDELGIDKVPTVSADESDLDLSPPVAEVGEPDLSTASAPKRSRRGPSVPLLVTAGVVGATSLTLYGLSWQYRDNALDGAQSQEEYEFWRQRTNQASVASAGTGVVAVGVGTMAFLWTRW